MRVLLTLLGAANFPRRPDLSSPAFEASHVALRDWMLDKANGPMVAGKDCLDLFGSPRSWPDQEAELEEWLKDRAATHPAPTDLIVHYVGHGGFRDASHDYYLAIHATRAENAYYSSIMVESLWRTLRNCARRQRRFLIIDACFAGAAARAYMAPLEEAVKVKVRDLQEQEGQQAVRDVVSMPDSGTAVLCSSSARDTASSAGLGGTTQFTDGLIQVLRTGCATAENRLSLSQVHALMKASLQHRYKDSAVIPELHSPDQRLGLPHDVPLFPNVAPFVSGGTLHSAGETKGKFGNVRQINILIKRYTETNNISAQDMDDIASLLKKEVSALPDIDFCFDLLDNEAEPGYVFAAAVAIQVRPEPKFFSPLSQLIGRLASHSDLNGLRMKIIYRLVMGLQNIVRVDNARQERLIGDIQRDLAAVSLIDLEKHHLCQLDLRNAGKRSIVPRIQATRKEVCQPPTRSARIKRST